MIAAGYCRNTAAITSPKIASTIVNATTRTIKNNRRTLGPSTSPATSPTVRPSFRIDTTSDPKSWTAPIVIDPTTIHTSAGNQPQITANAGPTIGPVPAIEVKWWPKTTPRRVATKSLPSA